MDMVIESEGEEMNRKSVSRDEAPVLMINRNRYTKNTFPDGALYKRWRPVNKKIIDGIRDKILWTFPKHRQILVNGHLKPLNEILAY